jgi:hypothetical protein
MLSTNLHHLSLIAAAGLARRTAVARDFSAAGKAGSNYQRSAIQPF